VTDFSTVRPGAFCSSPFMPTAEVVTLLILVRWLPPLRKPRVCSTVQLLSISRRAGVAERLV